MNQQTQQPAFQPIAASPVKVSRKPNPLYGIALLGGLLLIICSFLVWETFKINTLQLSISGMGAVSSSGDSNSPLASFVAAKATSPGVISIFFGGLVVLMAGLGLLLNKKGFAIAGIIFGLLGAAFMFLNFSQAMADGSDTTVTGTPGIGLYLGLVAGLLAVVGSIAALVAKRR